MTARQQALVNLFAEKLGSDAFNTEVTTTEIDEVSKPYFQRRTIDPADATRILKVSHERDALLKVCGALLGEGGVNKIGSLQSDDEARIGWKFVTAMLAQGGEPVAACVDATVTRAVVNMYYVSARPAMLDMFVHLSASEFFLVDGDSLVLMALAQYRVDWDLIQPLHVMHLIQKLLSDLKDRGGCFQVVFFENTQWIWSKSPKKFFIRENVRDALLSVSAQQDPLNAASLAVKSFASYHCPEFDAHVQQYGPEFILMWDGEQMGEQCDLHQLYTNKEQPYRSILDDVAVGNDAAFYYHCFLIWALTRRMKVAYASRIVYVENAMLVFVVNNSGERLSCFLEIDEAVTTLASKLEQRVPVPELSADAKAASEDTEVSLREQIVSGALYAFLNDESAAIHRTPESIEMCKALVVTVYVTSFLNSELRAQAPVACEGVSHFLTLIAPYLTSALRHRGCMDGKGAEFDLIDGHLFAAVVRELRSASVADLLDEDGVNDVNFAWQAVSASEELITEAALATLPPVTTSEVPAVGDYPKFGHELVRRLAKAFDVAGYTEDAPFPSGHGKAERLAGWDIVTPFDELNDVIDEVEEAEKSRNVTDKSIKQENDIRTRYIVDATEAARALGIKAFVNTNEFANVPSDSDDDTNTNSKPREEEKKSEHAGQRNKKNRSKEDIIREERNVREATRMIRDIIKSKDLLMRKTDLPTDRSTSQDRDEAAKTIRSALNTFPDLAKSFDPGADLGVTPEGTPVHLAMWRLLVAESGERESDLALGGMINEAKTKKKDDSIPVFTLIDDLLARELKQAGNWGKVDVLRTADRIANVYDATTYLRWVYLRYVELHFKAKYSVRVLKLMLDSWKQERERARLAKEEPCVKNGGIDLFIACHQDVLNVVRDNQIALSADDLDVVRSALSFFDFPQSYLDKVDQFIVEKQGRALSILPQGLKPRQKLLNTTPERMQLEAMGHLLERPIPPQRDYRVLFNPDQWQRDVLDIVDRRDCAVVCAPTSAGKTFISYYCMFKTLKMSNNKIVLYVAPTRALINQAVADVCARYGSKRYRSLGKNVFGVLGGDEYHMYHDECQILITLPEQLETLLLSPKYTKLVKRFDYAVLDEIHTMESSGNGDVWERVLALLPCPFVALSATLGETQQLRGWLQRCLQRHSQQNPGTPPRSVSTIPLTGKIERWNDIQKYMYLPQPGTVVPVKKLTSKFEHRFIRDLHPLSILTLSQLRRGFPPDLSLVPSESVALYDRLAAEFKASVWLNWSSVPAVQEMKSSLDYLKPEVYFASDIYITQTRARQYEQDVKNEFLIWVYYTTAGEGDEGLSNVSNVAEFNVSMTASVETILRSFSQTLTEVEKSLDDYALQHREAPFPDSARFMEEHIISVVRELSSRDMGPTIVFSFESESCNDLVESVVTQLERAEDEYRATDEFARYRQVMKAKAEAKEAQKKQRESTMKQKKLNKGDGGEIEENDRDISDGEGDEENFDIPDVLPEFTFIGQQTTVDPIQLSKWLERCEETGTDLYARAIRRGIGIHHAGVPGKVRRVMERLFCGRHCSVIFSTETLALGIHSPCRSVVLAGDHVLLNTTQFRQMIGRAGRRGLDFIGHVVFLSISMKKITRLMTSGMTVIKGNVQMDPLQCLRLLQLYDFHEHRANLEPNGRAKPLKDEEKAEWKRTVLNNAERLFVNPLFFQGRSSIQGGNMEGFTIKYLQMLLKFFNDEGLMFSDSTSSLGSLLVDVMSVFRTPATGNDGFAFISMLTESAFHDAGYQSPLSWIDAGDSSGDGIDESVVELLSYIFSVHPLNKVPYELHRSALSDPMVWSLWDSKADRSSKKRHRVALSPLGYFQGRSGTVCCDAFFRLLSAFYSSEAASLGTPAREVLPFMTPKTKKKYPIFGKVIDGLPIVEKLGETRAPFKARHPFVAISGCGDHFDSIDDVTSTLRDGLFCDRRMIPLVEFTDSGRHDHSQVIVNAALADFIRVKAQFDSSRKNYRNTLLEQLNGLRISESYALLDRSDVLLGNIAGLMGNVVATRDILGRLLPLESDKDGAFFAGAARILPVAQRLHSLRSQIDQKYYSDQRTEKVQRERVERMKQRAGIRKALGGM